MVDKDHDGAAAHGSLDGTLSDKICGRVQEQYVNRVVQQLSSTRDVTQPPPCDVRHGDSAMGRASEEVGGGRRNALCERRAHSATAKTLAKESGGARRSSLRGILFRHMGCGVRFQ